MAIQTIERALERLREGKMVILVDDEDRENEGDLCMLAERVTADDINFMAKYGRGLICVTMPEERMRKLELLPMVSDNTSRLQTAFTISIEAKTGVTTGISAADRAHTIRTAVDADAQASDLARPGHVFPITARNGGVLTRVGQTEGSVDLAKLAGARVAAGVICEIMDDDGTMARMPQLLEFSERFDMPIVTIADLISYRLRSECHVVSRFSSLLKHGIAHGFQATILENAIDDSQHLALVYGELDDQKPPLVRVHRATPLGDLFGINRLEKQGIHATLERIRSHGSGVLLYLASDSPGMLEELSEQTAEIDEDSALNRVAPETRLYGLGAQCLRQLGVQRMYYLSDTQRTLVGIEAFGLEIVDYISF